MFDCFTIIKIVQKCNKIYKNIYVLYQNIHYCSKSLGLVRFFYDFEESLLSSAKAAFIWLKINENAYYCEILLQFKITVFY